LHHYLVNGWPHYLVDRLVGCVEGDGYGEVMILDMTRVINYCVVGSIRRRMKRWRLIGRTCRIIVKMEDVVKVIGAICRSW
jgi:hypothetical protein